MTGRRRRELTDSFRLLASDERWLLRDLLVGVVAFVVWVAGTGALATEIASLLDVPLGVGGGETPSRTAIALFSVLWLVAPAVAVVVRLRTRLLNLRGNVEQYYRFDHPAALLAPPALLVLVLAVAAVALGAFPWYFALALVPVGLFVLVRTLAFSYRVYSFSRPLIVQALAALSIALALGSVFAALGTATGRDLLVDRTLRAVGIPSWIAGTVSVEGVAVSGVAVVALAPVFLSLAYVLVQTVVSVAVRLAEPDVDRSKMRTGQRYPPFLPATTPVQSSAAGTGGDADAPGTGTGGPPADAAGESVATDRDETDDHDGADEGEDDDLDDVSNTRVFTPPADDSGSGFDTGADPDDESASGAPSTRTGGPSPDVASGETRAVSSDGDGRDASTADAREHCDDCGESFTVDTAVRFCPNCGAALGAE